MGESTLMTGPYPLGGMSFLQALGIQDPTPADTQFMQRYQLNKQGNPDDLYTQYMKHIQLPASGAALPSSQSGMVMSGIRRALPFMDTAQGHQDLQSTLHNYPFTPAAADLLKSTVIRSSTDPEVVQEEADTKGESYLGFPTGREKMRISERDFVSPPASVPAHELMHSYLDMKGYPYGQDAFNKDWEAAKTTNPLLHNIDQFLATSPDYTDEQNPIDLSQERFAYLAQALSGGGLKAFPKELQRHYAGIFR